jgi:hypothetical protein
MNDENHQTDVLVFDGSDTPFKKKLEDGGYKVITIGKSKNVYMMYD